MELKRFNLDAWLKETYPESYKDFQSNDAFKFLHVQAVNACIEHYESQRRDNVVYGISEDINNLPAIDLDEVLRKLEEEIKDVYNLYERTKRNCTIIAEHITPEIAAKNIELQSEVFLNYERIRALEYAKSIISEAIKGVK